MQDPLSDAGAPMFRWEATESKSASGTDTGSANASDPAADEAVDAASGAACAASSDTGQGSPGEIDKRLAQRSQQPTPLAFVIAPGNGGQDRTRQKRMFPVTVASWSAAALAQFQALGTQLAEQQKQSPQIPRVSLPITSLRVRFELGDEQIERIDRRLGLAAGGSPSVLLWTQTEPAASREALNGALMGWLVNDVSRLAAFTDGATGRCVDRLKQLAREGKAIDTQQRLAQPYHWAVSQMRTAMPIGIESYPDLADCVARHLEGHVVFPGLAGLRRIVTGDLREGVAELMTEPIVVGQGARFSLVVSVRVISYPGRPSPVITIGYSRRVWVGGLKDRASGAGTISGYALPDGSSRALRFTLRRTKSAEGTWSYQPDHDFSPISRRYLADALPSVQTIVDEGHRLPGCKLLLGLRHGVGERSEVKNGVPDLDKLAAFEHITALLGELDLQPWHGLVLIESPARPAHDRNQHWRKRASTDHAERAKYTAWLQEAQESLRACYDGTYNLVIGVQPDPDVAGDAVDVERRLRDILPGSVCTTRIPIPRQAHGPRAQLPGSNLTDRAARAAIRAQEWKAFIDVVRQHEAQTGRRVDGVLVLAREWYPGRQHDDVVNKRAGHIALAKGLGTAVQYLRPSREAGEDGDPVHTGGTPNGLSGEAQARRDEEFETRLMNAWLDLAYSSLGRVRPVKLHSGGLGRRKQRLEEAFGAYPDRILALTVVRRNTSPFLANERCIVPCAIELDVASGVCTASFAYEDAVTRALAQSEPLPLPQALMALASLSPTQLQLSSVQTDRRRALEERTQAFFRERLGDFARRSERPLVLMDADSCQSVWPWLQNAHIDPDNVRLAGGNNVQVAWPEARLVRIRTANHPSPKVLWDNSYIGQIIETQQRLEYRAPGWAKAQLFRLSDTEGTNVYLSFGSAIRTGQAKGRSSYRQVAGMKRIRQSGRYQAAILEPFTDAWATPNGVEIVVVRANGDDPDQIARLVEWLRQCYAHFGDWTIKPAPLFFERVLKEYLPDYDLDDDDNQTNLDEG